MDILCFFYWGEGGEGGGGLTIAGTFWGTYLLEMKKNCQSSNGHMLDFFLTFNI